MISASALVANCAYRRVLKARKPRTPNMVEAADRGTAFHAAIEKWVAHGEPPVLNDMEMQGWIDMLAAEWSPLAGTRTEIAWGLSPDGDHVMVQEPKPHVYEAMDGRPLLTAGRADVAWMLPGSRTLAVVDWKTGRWPVAAPQENLQANAGGLALAKRFEARAYMPDIYYARDGYFDWGDVVEVDGPSGARALEMVKAAAQLDETPRPGPWCASCWERRDCASADSGE